MNRRLQIMHTRRKLRDMHGKICLILTTIDDEQKARHLARSLINEHLAACVQMFPGICTTYRWQGKMEEAGEILLQIKTAPERASDVFSWLERHHPYELPEIIQLDGLASESYSNWATNVTTFPGQRS